VRTGGIGFAGAVGVAISRLPYGLMAHVCLSLDPLGRSGRGERLRRSRDPTALEIRVGVRWRWGASGQEQSATLRSESNRCPTCIVPLRVLKL
jgi:hypothetical protein